MKRLFAGVLACLCVSSGLAHAQTTELHDLNHKIERLGEQLGDLERHVYNAESLPAAAPGATSGTLTDSGLQLHAAQQEFQEQLRRLTGRIEALEHGQAQLTRRLDELLAALDNRLQSLERTVAGTVPVVAAAQSPGDIAADDTADPADETPGVLPPGTQMEQYNHAFSLLRKADHESAEVAFREFVALYPESDLNGNAHFWLGSTHLVREQYRDAAVAFLKGYQHAPEGPKAADNLLKLAVSLVHLGKTDEACATFRELRNKFPDAGQTLLGEASRESSAAGCA